MSRAVDPGWGEAARLLPSMLLPTRGMRLAAGGTAGLTVMRVLWLTFVASMLLLGIVVVVIDSVAPGGGVDGRVVGGVVAALGVGLQAVSVRFLPDLAGRTVEEVRAAVQRIFFLRVAFAEPAALLGFMGFVVSGNVAVYVIGAVIGLAGMYDAAPSAGWLARSAEQLRSSGSDVDLLDAVTRGGLTR